MMRRDHPLDIAAEYRISSQNENEAGTLAMGTKRFDCLGDFCRHDFPVAVRCRVCGHYVEMDPGPLMMRWGYGRHPRDLPWTCSQCGAKGNMIATAIDARLER